MIFISGKNLEVANILFQSRFLMADFYAWSGFYHTFQNHTNMNSRLQNKFIWSFYFNLIPTKICDGICYSYTALNMVNTNQTNVPQELHRYNFKWTYKGKNINEESYISP